MPPRKYCTVANDPAEGEVFGCTKLNSQNWVMGVQENPAITVKFPVKIFP